MRARQILTLLVLPRARVGRKRKKQCKIMIS